ncbi:MAG: cytochrome c [Vulcanimicrobiota bacterium]
MKFKSATIIAILTLFLLGCSGGPNEVESFDSTPAAPESTEPAPTADDPMSNRGVGPIKSLALEAIDEKLAKSGEDFFRTKCAACHRMDKRRVGPSLGGITERRTPEWIMNMIMNPTEMLEKDPIAKELLAEYATQMADQNVDESEARAILEFLRTQSAP